MSEPVEVTVIPKKVWLALAFIFFLGASLRVYNLGESSLWYDEAASIKIGNMLNPQIDILNPLHNNEAPMMGVQAKVWVTMLESLGFTDKTSHARDFMIRLLPAIWSMLSIALIFLLGREIFNKNEPALLAAMFLAVSPLHLVYAQELRIYSFYVFASLLALLFMHRALYRGHFADWAFMTLLFTTLVYSHFIAIWTVFAFNLAFLWHLYLEKKNLGKWFVANAVMMALLLPVLYLAYISNQTLSEIEYAWFPDPTLKLGLLTFKSFFAGFGSTVWAYWPLFLLGMALFPLGACFLWQCGRRFEAGLLLIVGLFPVLFNLVFWRLHDFSFYEHRTYIVSGAVLLMLMAYGVCSVPWRGLRVVFAALIVFLSAPLLRDYYGHRLHPVEEHRLALWDKPDYRSVAKYLKGEWRKGDMLGFVGHFNAFSMPYYFDGDQYNIATEELYIDVAYKSLGAKNIEMHPELKPVLIQPLLEKHLRLWFLRSNGTTFEWQPNSENIQLWLDSNLHKVDTQEFKNLTLVLYEIKS